MPIEVPQGKGKKITVVDDESPRPDIEYAKIAKLPTVYDSPTVTAANAPGLSTGASALCLMTRTEATRRGKEPLATLMGWAMASGHPDRIASIPAEAIRLALNKVKMTIDDVDLIEINEAFAAVPLLSSYILAGKDQQRAEKIREKVNVNGGAIALGHPTGATGGRLVMTLMYELRRRYKLAGGSRPFYGVVGICGGVGEAESVVVKVG